MSRKKLTRILVLMLFLLFTGLGLQAGAKESEAKKEEKKIKGVEAVQPPAAVKEVEIKKDQPNQGPVAVVNGEPIEQAELDKAMGRIQERMAMMGQTPNAEQMSEIRKDIVENLIEAELLHQEAQKLNIQVSEDDMKKRIEALQKLFPKPEDFKDALSKAGITEEDLKTQVKRELTVKKLVDQEVASKVSVSDNATKAYYDANPENFKAPEQVCASHILIKVDPKATEAEKKKAREKLAAIQEKLKKGGDFAALAKENSDCPSKEKGGDLGCFQKGQMVGPFEETAFKLKPGEMSDIVETEFGYHLIKVTDKKPARVIPYEEVKEKIQDYLKKQETDKQMSQYLDQLKAKAKIERLVQPVEPPKAAAPDNGTAPHAQPEGTETKEAPKPAKE